jgi:uncharacterized protein YgiM (DUF1202 family)
MRKTLFLTLVGAMFLAVPGWAALESIGKDNVNIRSGPGLQNSIIFQAPLGYPIDVEKEEGQWVYFRDWENYTGWVYKPLVSSINTAVIQVDHANIRKGPGLNYGVVLQADKGEIFKVFKKKGNWVQVGYYLENTVVGWIRQDLVWGE